MVFANGPTVESAKFVERRNAEIVACLDAAEVEQFSRLLDRLVEHARSTSESGSEALDA